MRELNEEEIKKLYNNGDSFIENILIRIKNKISNYPSDCKVYNKKPKVDELFSNIIAIINIEINNLKRG